MKGKEVMPSHDSFSLFKATNPMLFSIELKEKLLGKDTGCNFFARFDRSDRFIPVHALPAATVLPALLSSKGNLPSHPVVL